MKYMLLIHRDESIHGNPTGGEHSAPYMAYAQAPAANAAYLRAIGLETDPAVRAFLEERRRPVAAGA